MRLAVFALLITTELCHAAQEDQTVTYGPWKGHWLKVCATAYSPHDAIDKDYHATKGDRWRWITADGRTDVRKVPYGIAASSLPFGTRVYIPAGSGYLEKSHSAPLDRVFRIDDRGSRLSEELSRTGTEQIDLRYRTEYSALRYGRRDLWIFVIHHDVKPAH